MPRQRSQFHVLCFSLLLAARQVQGAPPANDNFADRSLLNGFPIAVEADNTEATREPGEPLHASSFQSHSLWWSWTAPFSGRIGLMITKPFTPEAVAVYLGNSLDSLVEVARQLPAGLLPLEVQEGVTYQIAVDGSNQGTEGAFRLELLRLPPNDLFRDRIIVPPGGAWLTGTTTLSTHEEGEPGYAQNGWAGSVWYSWTPDVSGPVWLTTVGSSFAADIYIFKGNSITELAGVPRLSALFEAEAGVTYQFAITGFHAAGDFRFGILRAAPNDTFANRTSVQGFSFVLEGWTLLASAQPGEPDAGASPDSLHSVWWTWTAPAAGRVLIRDRPGNIAGFTVFKGTNLAQLVQVPTSGGAFEAVAGQTYQLRASNPEGGGLASSAWTLYPGASNDAFARRTALVGSSLVVTAWNFNATREAGEPRHADFNAGRPRDERWGPMRGNSVWWTWTAPVDGWVHIDPVGSDFDPVIAVYTGESLRRLKRVTLNQDLVYGTVGGVAEFQAAAGVTYQIVMEGGPTGDHRRPVPGEGRLSFTLDLTTLVLTKPAQASVFTGPTDLALQVNQPDPSVDGHLDSVQFFTQTYNNAAVPLATSGPSLTAVATNALPGYYLLYARGTNEEGRTRISQPTVIAIRPSNDQFSNSQLLEGYSFTNYGYIGAATWEPGEKKIGGGPPGSGSVWWSWTAPASGTAKLVIYGGDTASVWSGVNLRGLKRLAYTPFNELTFKTKLGVRYYFSTATFGQTLFNSIGPGTLVSLELVTVELAQPAPGLVLPEPASIPLAIRTSEPTNAIVRVDYYTGNELVASSAQPPFSAVWSNAPAWTHQIRAVLVKKTGERLSTTAVTVFVRPANDQFANAFGIAGTNVQTSGIGISASLEPGEPAGNILGTIWWRWTAPLDGRVVIRNGTNGFLRMNVYTGSALSNLVSVLDPPGAIRFDGVLTFRAHVGETYYFAVEGAGRVGFELNLVLPPDNDSFAQRRQLASDIVKFEVYNFAATSEPGEPVHSGQAGGRSVWFTWTAPRSGTVRLSNRGVGYNMSVAVYTGSVLSNLTRIAEIPTDSQTIWFNVVKDVAYSVAVGDLREGVWNIPVDLTYEGPPANDLFAQAFDIPGPYLQGTILGATREPDEPAHGGAAEGNSAWWKWTAPAAGTIQAIVMTPYFKPRIAVYSGTTLANLALVATATNQLDASVTGGTPYRVAIDTADGRVGGFLFEFHVTPALVPSADSAAARTDVVATPQRLRVQIQRLGQMNAEVGSAIHVLVQGELGGGFVLEASEDLVNWEELARGVLVGDGFEFTEPVATRAPQRFYRALSVP